MKKLSVAFLAGSTLLASSCGKFVDGYEISPNEPVEVTNTLLLNYIEVSTFSVTTGQLARLAAVLTQQQAGTSDQFVPFAKYQLLAGDNVNEWETIYSGSLVNAQKLIDQAGDANPHFRGIGRVLKAMNLGLATDFWGDIPNSEALKGIDGAENYTPAFDPQENVIADIQQLLSDAIADFATAEEDNAELPYSDVIFAGDVTKWTITAHILKARYANRLSKRDAAASATAALAAIDAAVAAGMTDWSNDCMAIFGTSPNEFNQWNSFSNTRSTYMRFGKFFIDTLETMVDPRLPFYAAVDNNGGYSGSAPDAYDDATSSVTDMVNDATYFGSTTAPLPLVTYAEAKFIEAEAALRSGDASRAADAYNTAVTSHIMMVTGSAPDAAYTLAYASKTSADITLSDIMTQKYIAMFTQPEVWSDWRRTNLPALTPNPDASITGIPRRLLTPQSELNYNPNAPQFINLGQLLTPVWWDE